MRMGNGGSVRVAAIMPVGLVGYELVPFAMFLLLRNSEELKLFSRRPQFLRCKESRFCMNEVIIYFGM